MHQTNKYKSKGFYESFDGQWLTTGKHGVICVQCVFYAFQVSFYWFVLLSLAWRFFLNGPGSGFKAQWSQEESSASEWCFKWVCFFLAESRTDVYCGEWIKAETQDAFVLCACRRSRKTSSWCLLGSGLTGHLQSAHSPGQAVYTLNTEAGLWHWAANIAC